MLWHESLGGLDDRCPEHRIECKPRYVRARNHGRFHYFHDALLAIPKLFAAVLGGSPALSGGDLVSSGAFVAGGALAVGSIGLSALGAVAGASGLLSSGAAAGGGVAGSSSAGASSSPAMLASVGSNPGGSGTVPPPTNPSPAPSRGPSQPSAPLSDAAKNLTGLHRRISSQVPPDAGPHATPPKMNLDHNE